MLRAARSFRHVHGNGRKRRSRDVSAKDAKKFFTPGTFLRSRVKNLHRVPYSNGFCLATSLGGWSRRTSACSMSVTLHLSFSSTFTTREHALVRYPLEDHHVALVQRGLYLRGSTGVNESRTSRGVDLPPLLCSNIFHSKNTSLT